MNLVRRALSTLDEWQQRHAVVAFPLAVAKKFGDDQAGNLAALLAWNAFAAVFPLLLVLVTVLGLILRGNPHLQAQIMRSALVDFPIIGTQLKANVHSLSRSGLGLGVGLVLTFLGARGVAGAAQTAMNSVWEVPRRRRPGFPGSLFRSVALLSVLGIGVIATTTLAGIGGGGGTIGVAVRVAAIAVAFALNVGVFLLVFRLATAAEVALRDLWLGALLTAVVWQLLQVAGGYLVAHYLRHATAVYGLFGLVLGLMSWLYLQAELTLYAVEADVVRTRRLWPRSMFASTRTPADEAALRAYGRTEERQDGETVQVSLPGPRRRAT
ncbi:MAG TPA: YihY/virulence factor BrkB family protein [Mycobacteriales bacterium]|nr:YihY/virulence factor BrkB family protein [Mycobacteriales bacterium]